MIYILTITLFFGSVMPRYVDLNEDERHLYRAAFSTPSYNTDLYVEDDSEENRLDLLNGMWMVKAKLTELSMFNKALAANLLSTKLKLKELIADHMLLKKQHHEIIDIKPLHNYQPPSNELHTTPRQDQDPYYGY